MREWGKKAVCGLFCAAILLGFCGCENSAAPDSGAKNGTQRPAQPSWKPVEGAEKERLTPVPLRTREPRRTEIPHG